MNVSGDSFGRAWIAPSKAEQASLQIPFKWESCPKLYDALEAAGKRVGAAVKREPGESPESEEPSP